MVGRHQQLEDMEFEQNFWMTRRTGNIGMLQSMGKRAVTTEQTEQNGNNQLSSDSKKHMVPSSTLKQYMQTSIFRN